MPNSRFVTVSVSTPGSTHRQPSLYTRHWDQDVDSRLGAVAWFLLSKDRCRQQRSSSVHGQSDSVSLDFYLYSKTKKQSKADKHVWLIPGAGRGLGLDLDKTVPTTGHAVVAARGFVWSRRHKPESEDCNVIARPFSDRNPLGRWHTMARKRWGLDAPRSRSFSIWNSNGNSHVGKTRP